MSNFINTNVRDGIEYIPQVEKRDLYRVIAASAAGSAMEWYDFSIYGTASALIFSDIFFPGLDKFTALLAAFATYALGFVARPIGGIFFGRLGDRRGRKVVLVTTVLLMGISTFLIGLLPTYKQIGIGSTVLLILLRLLQGFGSGAEQAGASLIVSEFAPADKRGFYASLPFAGIIVGILLAAGVFTAVQALPDAAFQSWGWRIPFLMSALVVAVGIIIRLRVKESPVFEQMKIKNQASKQPIRDLFQHSRKNLIVACGLRIGENGTSYLYQVFMLSYLTKVLLIDKSVGTGGLIISTAISLFTIPFIGYLSDKVGRRTMYRLTSLVALLWAFPAFMLFNTREPSLIYLSLTIAVSLGTFGMYAVQGAYFPELFDARYRYTGIAISKEFASLISGGIAPFIAAALLTLASGHYWPVACYIIFLAGVSFISTFFAPETKGIDLNV